MKTRPEIILGPPGTGKTTTLLSIVDDELQRGVSPDRIAFVSFTRRATNVAIERACSKFNLTANDLPNFRTLHSLCYRYLGLRTDDVMEKKKLDEFADYAGIELTGRNPEDGTLIGLTEGDRMMFLGNLARIRCETLRQTYERDPDVVHWYELERIDKAYYNFKMKYDLLDYTDMLTEFITQAPRLGFEVLLIDESQDLSRLQWQVINILSQGARRAVVAGDDDQAIFSWAGADVQHLIKLEGERQVLGKSWRVPRLVQEAALRIINRVKDRLPKTWSPRDIDGHLDVTRSFAQTDLSGEDVLVLTRNNYVSREQVEPELRARGILYECNGVPSLKPKLKDAIISWERLRRGESVSVEEVRGVYELMRPDYQVQRGFKTLTGFADRQQLNLEELKAKGGLLTDAPWYDALGMVGSEDQRYIRVAVSSGERISKPPRVRLSTIHSAKGAEASKVILLSEMGRKTFREAERDTDAEARVWYVGATRAMDSLTIVDSQTKQGYVL